MFLVSQAGSWPRLFMKFGGKVFRTMSHAIARGHRQGRVAMVTLAGIILLSVGCASSQRDPESSLPFHVAVIPVQTLIVEPTEKTKGDDAFEMQIKSPAISRSLRNELKHQCFERVTLLPYPEETPLEDFLALPPREQDNHWVAAASAAQADLILQPELRFQTAVESERNHQFWLNLPLFLLGGPFCYFVPDHRYHGDATLSWALYDLNPILAERSKLGRSDSVLLATDSRAREVDLNFLSRAGTRFQNYAISFLVPAGLLAQRGIPVERQVESRIVEDLAEDVARRVNERREDLLQARTLVNFYLEPESVEIERLSPDELEIEADVILRRGGGIDALNEYELISGGEPVYVTFEEAEIEQTEGEQLSRYARYRIRQTVAVENGSETIRLRVFDASPEQNTRSFTFGVPRWEKSQARPVPATANESGEVVPAVQSGTDQP